MPQPGTARPGEFLTTEVMDDVLVRLAKTAGPVQGVSRMVRDSRHRVDLPDQIAAVQKALDGVSRKVTRNYLQRCVTEAVKGDDPLIYDELTTVLFRHR